MIAYKVQLITADGSKYFLNVEKDQLILDAALESGMNLPYSGYQTWSIIGNYDAIHEKENDSKISKVKNNRTVDSYHESQELLDRLLNEEKKGRPIHNSRIINRNRRFAN